MACTSSASICCSSTKLHVLQLLLLLSLASDLCHETYPFLLTPAASANPPPQTLAILCNTTTSPHFCLATLSNYPSCKPSAHLQDLTAYVVARALKLVNRTYSTGRNLSANEDAAAHKYALQDCLELLDNSVEPLSSSVDRLSCRKERAPLTGSQLMDVRVWLSSALTFMDTCWDELSDPAAAALKAQMNTIDLKIEPLLGMAMVMAARLQDDGGASMYYELPGKPRHGTAAAGRHGLKKEVHHLK